MQILLLSLGLMVAAAVVLGFHRGWFSVTARAYTRRPHVTVSVDNDKIEADTEKVMEQLAPSNHRAQG